MIDFDNHLPRAAIMYSMMLAHLNSALNPILYAVFNPAYRRGYKNLLFYFKTCKKRKENIIRIKSDRNIRIVTIFTQSNRINNNLS